MIRRSCLVLLPAALAAVGCAPNTEPTYAFDPIWLEPAAEGGVHGLQSWQLYGPRWIENSDPDTYACTVLVELFADPAECDADPDCAVGWQVASAEVVASDCADAQTADPLFLSLLRLGIGGPDPSPDAPHPGQTSVGWADYGNGWEVHGHAYPEALDFGAEVEATGWDGTQPYLLVPTKSFELGATAGTGA